MTHFLSCCERTGYRIFGVPLALRTRCHIATLQGLADVVLDDDLSYLMRVTLRQICCPCGDGRTGMTALATLRLCTCDLYSRIKIQATIYHRRYRDRV